MEWVVVAVAILVLFGAKRIPELMRGVGKGMRDFNDAKDKVSDDFHGALKPKEAEVVK